MKKTIVVFMATALLAGLLSGCNGKESASIQSTNPPTQNETAQPEPSADEQISESEVHDFTETAENLTQFESDLCPTH